MRAYSHGFHAGGGGLWRNILGDGKDAVAGAQGVASGLFDSIRTSLLSLPGWVDILGDPAGAFDKVKDTWKEIEWPEISLEKIGDAFKNIPNWLRENVAKVSNWIATIDPVAVYGSIKTWIENNIPSISNWFPSVASIQAWASDIATRWSTAGFAGTGTGDLYQRNFIEQLAAFAGLEIKTPDFDFAIKWPTLPEWLTDEDGKFALPPVGEWTWPDISAIEWPALPEWLSLENAALKFNEITGITWPSVPDIAWPALPSWLEIQTGTLKFLNWAGDINWPSVPEITWPELPSWIEIQAGTMKFLAWTGDINWPTVPTISWPSLPSWAEVQEGALAFLDWTGNISWPEIPTINWPTLPSWIEIKEGALGFVNFIGNITWPSIPSISWPELPSWLDIQNSAIRFRELTGNINWPTMPAISWPELPSWMEIREGALAFLNWTGDINWPTMPAINWPSLPTWLEVKEGALSFLSFLRGLSWPEMPTLNWPELPNWLQVQNAALTFLTFISGISWPTIPAINWPSLPTWLEIKEGALAFLSVTGSISWPEVPTINWPALPEWIKSPDTIKLPDINAQDVFIIAMDALGAAFETGAMYGAQFNTELSNLFSSLAGTDATTTSEKMSILEKAALGMNVAFSSLGLSLGLALGALTGFAGFITGTVSDEILPEEEAGPDKIAKKLLEMKEALDAIWATENPIATWGQTIKQAFLDAVDGLNTWLEPMREVNPILDSVLTGIEGVATSIRRLFTRELPIDYDKGLLPAGTDFIPGDMVEGEFTFLPQITWQDVEDAWGAIKTWWADLWVGIKKATNVKEKLGTYYEETIKPAWEEKVILPLQEFWMEHKGWLGVAGGIAAMIAAPWQWIAVGTGIAGAIIYGIANYRHLSKVGAEVVETIRFKGMPKEVQTAYENARKVVAPVLVKGTQDLTKWTAAQRAAYDLIGAADDIGSGDANWSKFILGDFDPNLFKTRGSNMASALWNSMRDWFDNVNAKTLFTKSNLLKGGLTAAILGAVTIVDLQREWGFIGTWIEDNIQPNWLPTAEALNTFSDFVQRFTEQGGALHAMAEDFKAIAESMKEMMALRPEQEISRPDQTYGHTPTAQLGDGLSLPMEEESWWQEAFSWTVDKIVGNMLSGWELVWSSIVTENIISTLVSVVSLVFLSPLALKLGWALTKVIGVGLGKVLANIWAPALAIWSAGQWNQALAEAYPEIQGDNPADTFAQRLAADWTSGFSTLDNALTTAIGVLLIGWKKGILLKIKEIFYAGWMRAPLLRALGSALALPAAGLAIGMFIESHSQDAPWLQDDLGVQPWDEGEGGTPWAKAIKYNQEQAQKELEGSIEKMRELGIGADEGLASYLDPEPSTGLFGWISDSMTNAIEAIRIKVTNFIPDLIASWIPDSGWMMVALNIFRDIVPGLVIVLAQMETDFGGFTESVLDMIEKVADAWAKALGIIKAVKDYFSSPPPEISRPDQTYGYNAPTPTSGTYPGGYGTGASTPASGTYPGGYGAGKAGSGGRNVNNVLGIHRYGTGGLAMNAQLALLAESGPEIVIGPKGTKMLRSAMSQNGRVTDSVRPSYPRDAGSDGGGRGTVIDMRDSTFYGFDEFEDKIGEAIVELRRDGKIDLLK